MLYLICNPTAGNGRAKKISQAIMEKLKNLNIAFQCACTQYPGHATCLAEKAVENGANEVLSIGGDGTAYEVAAALKDSPAALGIIPAGTGNDFIKTLGYPADPMQALDHVLSHPAKKTDIGLCGNHIFLNEAGTGFDVTVLQYAEKAKKYCRGLLPYLYGVICTTLHFKPTMLTYQIDDQPPVTQPSMVCAVANGGIIGGGIPIAPLAKVDDGLLDVVIVKAVPRARIPGYLPKLLTGKILSFPETMYCRCKKISFSAPDMILNLDGELKKVPSVSLAIGENALLVHR